MLGILGKLSSQQAIIRWMCLGGCLPRSPPYGGDAGGVADALAQEKVRRLGKQQLLGGVALKPELPGPQPNQLLAAADKLERSNGGADDPATRK